jgi:phage baseplate assembly protein W
MSDIKTFFSDLPLDISIDPSGDIGLAINASAIKQSLRMIIETGRGTRLFLPEYGARIRAFLFEPFDETTAKRIGEELRESIQNYESRITLLDINVIMRDATTSYDVEVIYQITNTRVTDTVVITLEKL